MASLKSYDTIEMLACGIESELRDVVAKEVERRLVQEFRDNIRFHIGDLVENLTYKAASQRDVLQMRDELRVFVDGVEHIERG